MTKQGRSQFLPSLTMKSKMHKKLCLSAADRVLEVQQVILNLPARDDAGFSAGESHVFPGRGADVYRNFSQLRLGDPKELPSFFARTNPAIQPATSHSFGRQCPSNLRVIQKHSCTFVKEAHTA